MTRRLAPFRHLLVLSLLLLFTGSAWAEVCKGSKVKKADLTIYDQGVVLTQAERDTAIQTHLPYGTSSCPRLLPHREYVVCYDLDHRVPRWAAYKLTSADLGPAQRLDAFRTAAPSQLWPADFASAHRSEACSPPN